MNQKASIGEKDIPVTVLLAARNEEENLSKCISALSPAEHIIVIDSHSEDRTVEISKDAGAEVAQFDFTGDYPKKRQWAIDNLDIHTDWIILLDADEVITDKLWAEVKDAVSNNEKDAFVVLKEFHFMGKKFRFGGFSHRAVFLFKKGLAKFETMPGGCAGDMDMEIHERLLVEGQVGRLSANLRHEDFKGLEAYIERHKKYAQWESNIRYEYSKRGKWGESSVQPNLFGNIQERRRFLKQLVMQLPFESAIWFLYHYVFRLGFLEGRRGFMASSIRAQYIADVKRMMKEMRN